MISRLTKIQLVVFAIVTVLGGAFVGGRYAQIDRLFIDRTYPVTVALPDSGGIFAGAQVTYRGIPVGRVDEMNFTTSGVEAKLDIENSAPTSQPMSKRSWPTSRPLASSTWICSRSPTMSPTSRAAIGSGSRIRRSRSTQPLC